MRKVTRYICELCGATYETEDKARECEASHEIGKILNFEYAGGSMSNLISREDATLYGYQIEHLALIARVMEKEGITPEKVAELLRDVGKISEMVVDVTQTIREAVRRIDDDPSHPFADDVMMKE